MEPALKIRVAAPGDAAGLLAIYAPYVAETAITFEYEVPSLGDFRERISRTLERFPYLVAERGGELLGYAYMGVFKDRSAYDWAAETTIYLKRGTFGAGLGRALYTALEKVSAEQNIQNLEACIAYADPEDAHLTNASVKFHECLGYRLAGRFKKCGFKFGTWYDMVWMEKLLGEHSGNAPAVVPFPSLDKAALARAGVSA